MNHLKVCFVGVGSIAKRHIRNLKYLCALRSISLTIDAYRSNYVLAEGIDDVYTSISDVPKDYDVIFITNPTAFHFETLVKFHDFGKNFFIEKPVVSIQQIEEAKSFEINKNAIYYVASPLRFSPVIQYIKDNVSPEDIIAVRSISSSYLPDWRPGQDYRNTYSSHASMGGGVSVDLIHEWDYLTFLFGYPKKVYHLIGKKSSLEIDSDDYAIYIAEYEDKILELHLDYFGRKTIREIQLFTNDDTILCDIENNSISFMKTGKRLEFNETRDDFQQRELNYFLDLVIESVEYDGWHRGLDVLALTQGIL